MLFVSDTASYMVKPGENIKAFYSKIERVTSLAYSLHRVTEEVDISQSICFNIKFQENILKYSSRVGITI